MTVVALGVAVALVAAGGFVAYRSAQTTAAEPAIPAGASFDGLKLTDSEAAWQPEASDLLLRKNCAWGVPGRNPYKGTVTQALVAARLPDDVVRKIDAMVRNGIVSDKVEITRRAITSTKGSRRFHTTLLAMGFGNTVCLGTRVNFRSDHVEYANLYDATDATGARFSVMVPYVCGNVAVLAERAERPDDPASVEAKVTTIPEPGVLASLVAALCAWAVSAGIARRRDAREKANG